MWFVFLAGFLLGVLVTLGLVVWQVLRVIRNNPMLSTLLRRTPPPVASMGTVPGWRG